VRKGVGRGLSLLWRWAVRGGGGRSNGGGRGGDISGDSGGNSGSSLA